MSYEAKTDWQHDDVVTENDMNRIETGIEENQQNFAEHSAGVFHVLLEGSDNFNSIIGTSINHSIGHTDYRVCVTPTENPNGFLGEIWVEKSINNIMVMCSGSTSIKFDYIIFV